MFIKARYGTVALLLDLFSAMISPNL